ncbi:MAG: hypothetical protein CMH79_06090 [Nitrospinae bacterium]|nr:hypothetical protein [Nitrospinota bacterium]|tara:strand:- start:2220 stop:2711 length:492 start_codon:yes stop_codon:yes gene_type:complete
MDCKKLIIYGLIILVGLYLLKDICGFNLTSITEGMADFNSETTPEEENRVQPTDPNSQAASKNLEACVRPPVLTPKDLLPKNGNSNEVQKFNEQHPDGEGILKGVNYLEATFHAGVNTVGQSLRNANLNLRAEPPNPRAIISPWMNSTIDADLSRKPLSDGLN